MKHSAVALAALLFGLATAPALAGPRNHPRAAQLAEAPEAPVCDTCEGVRLLDERRFDAARRIFDHQVERGDVEAMYNLGWMYHHGLGVAVDYAKARDLYFKAAAGGQNVAMNQMGFLYQNGLGVPRNLATAYCWYSFALANAYAPSAKHIAEIEAQGGKPPPFNGACEAINHS